MMRPMRKGPGMMPPRPWGLSSAWSRIATAACPFENERLYCSENGPFLLRKEGDTLAGMYAMLASGELGAVVGRLDGHLLRGRWREVDQEGDIVVYFTPDRSAFEVVFRMDAEPERVYRRFRGALRYADGGSSFTLDNVHYRCE